MGTLDLELERGAVDATDLVHAVRAVISSLDAPEVSGAVTDPSTPDPHRVIHLDAEPQPDVPETITPLNRDAVRWVAAALNRPGGVMVHDAGHGVSPETIDVVVQFAFDRLGAVTDAALLAFWVHEIWPRLAVLYGRNDVVGRTPRHRRADRSGPES